MTIQAELPMIRPVSLQDLNKRLFYSELKDFRWPDDYFEFTAAKAELLDLRKERKALQIHPLTNESKLKALKPLHEKYEDRRIKFLSEHFGNWIGHHDPFKDLLRTAHLYFGDVGAVSMPTGYPLGGCRIGGFDDP